MKTTDSLTLQERLHKVSTEIFQEHLGSNDGQEPIFSYSGEIKENQIDAILKLVESGVLEKGGKRSLMKKIGSTLIEVVQNLLLHGARDDKGKALGLLLFTYVKGKFMLTSGNLLEIESAQHLSDKIDALNTLSHSEIRKLYIETLCNEGFSEKGGAGLGFLTMAKKSDGPIQYNITDFSDNLKYYVQELYFTI